ncbi:MAG TPA: DNA primase [Rhizomicrobium sp.]|jgi:DNA primase|nr:DNA primase [Rhizomicrobium sp.]
MRFGPNLLDEVLRRTDLVQLVGKRVKLVRKGRVMWGCCPFHKEKSPSFKVENERRAYKCFGCGAGGDAFKWLVETEGLTFPEAVERLAGEAGVELPKWSPEDEAREEKKKSLYDVVESACAFFEDQLHAGAGKEARDYLKARGLNDAVAKQFRLGYAPGGNSPLKDYLYTKNIALEDMVAAGVVRAGDDDRPARDFFFDRLMFPISDARGRVIAFGGRGLAPDAKPKYINTGETTLFSKGHLLYNFFTARPAALKSGTIVLAEGYMDVIALVRAGFDASVAPLGTALTSDQLQLLWRTAPEPILAFDGDEAGFRAAQRAARLALPLLNPGFSLRFAFLPSGEDPDSLLRAEGPSAMKALLGAAEPLARVLWRVETEGKDFSTPERRAGLERSLGEIVREIKDPKIADYYRRDFDEKVFETFKRRKPGAQPSKRPFRGAQDTSSPAPKEPPLPELQNSNVVRNHTGRPSAELEFVAFLFWHPEIAVAQGEILAGFSFLDPSLDRFRHELLNLAASSSRLENQGLEDHLVRCGMGELAKRLKAHMVAKTDVAQPDTEEDVEALWLDAVRQFRGTAPAAPDKREARERFHGDGTEESWNAYLAMRVNEG